jgi:hypothetical protein
MPTSRVARQPGASAVFGVASAMASISSLKAGHRALTPPVVMLPKNETRAAGSTRAVVNTACWRKAPGHTFAFIVGARSTDTGVEQQGPAPRFPSFPRRGVDVPLGCRLRAGRHAHPAISVLSANVHKCRATAPRVKKSPHAWCSQTRGKPAGTFWGPVQRAGFWCNCLAMLAC